MSVCFGVLDMELFRSSCGWNFYYFIGPAKLLPFLPVLNIILYMLHVHSLEVISPRSLHLSSYSFSRKHDVGRQKKWMYCVSIETRPISVFYERNREYGSIAIFYRAACVSICVAGMTSVSLC